MKLLLIFAAILAFSLAEEEKKEVDDSQAEASASIELMKEDADLKTAASTYNAYVPPSQRPPHWDALNYVPQNSWSQQPAKPIQPVHTGVPANVQNDYYDPHNNNPWNTPVYNPHPPTTTTPVSVIKNEQYFGENGHYKFEYKIADGTWVGEEGYYTDPKQTEESLVKKGWYSYVGADGKTYTVSWWADHTGYHAFGDHLPTPPTPVQPAYDNKKPLYDEPIQTPAPIYHPSQTPAPVYYPTQGVTFAPPSHKPVYIPPQPTYQPYIPPQQQYYPPQQTYYPQQPTNHV